jgi:hypothetical protein
MFKETKLPDVSLPSIHIHANKEVTASRLTLQIKSNNSGFEREL